MGLLGLYVYISQFIVFIPQRRVPKNSPCVGPIGMNGLLYLVLIFSLLQTVAFIKWVVGWWKVTSKMLMCLKIVLIFDYFFFALANRGNVFFFRAKVAKIELKIRKWSTKSTFFPKLALVF